MLLFSIILAILFLFGLGIQVLQTQSLIAEFHNYKSPEVTDGQLPQCAVLLCLRGCDPGIEERLEKLFVQDYPAYKVFIVFDNENDPAYAVTRNVIERQQPENVEIRVIEPSPHCSLVLNNFSKMLPEITDEFEIFVNVDVDVDIWPGWLRTLVAPLVLTDLAVIYGNRWYMPEKSNFGSLTRFIWNFGSVQQMVYFMYPWGGTIAYTSEFAKKTRLAEHYSKSYGHDTQLFLHSKKAGMKMAFHPAMMMPTYEDIGFKDFYRWMSRQLLHGRLYHPTWPLLLSNGILTALIIAIAIIVNLINLFMANWLPFAVIAVATMIYWIVMVGYIFYVDHIVTSMIARFRTGPGTVDSIAKRWWSPQTGIKIALITPLVQFVYLAAIFRATFLRIDVWRGIEYEICGPYDIRMIEYRPFQSTASTNQSII